MWTLKLSLALVLFGALIDASLDRDKGGGWAAYTKAGAPRPHLFSKTGKKYVGRCDDIGDPWENGSFTIVFHGGSSSGKSTLCCRLNGDDPKGNAGVDPNVGFTTEIKVYAANQEAGNADIRCFMLDTPGFGETSSEGQEWVRKGVDDAINKIHELRQRSPPAPLKRIYYVVNSSQKRQFQNLRTSLTLLYRAYQASLRSVRFVFTKCDSPEDSKDPNYFKDLVGELKKQYQETFQSNLDDNRILFVSSNGATIEDICIGQIRDDILAAAQDPNLDLVPNGVSIVNEYIEAKRSLERFTTDKKKSAELVKKYKTDIEALQKQQENKNDNLKQLRKSIDENSKLNESQQSELLDLIKQEKEMRDNNQPLDIIKYRYHHCDRQTVRDRLEQALASLTKANDDEAWDCLKNFSIWLLQVQDPTIRLVDEETFNNFCVPLLRDAFSFLGGVRRAIEIREDPISDKTKECILKFWTSVMNKEKEADEVGAKISVMTEEIANRTQTISENEETVRKMAREVDGIVRRLMQATSDLGAEKKTRDDFEGQIKLAQENLDKLTSEVS